MAEVSYGVVRWGSAGEAREFDNAMRMYPVVDLTLELADRAGELGARADEGGGRDVDEVDPIVAAVADHYGEPVLTRNVSDFEALGAEVETY